MVEGFPEKYDALTQPQHCKIICAGNSHLYISLSTMVLLRITDISGA